MPADASFSRCPACAAGPLSPRDDVWSCAGCGARYPVREGVPLLVRDWQAHERKLEAARASNPDWYVADQPVESASPWRHHVRKRRAYVESVLRRTLARRGVARGARLLDLGCGDGTNLAWLAPFAERVYGSDYNLLRLKRAQRRCPDATLFLGDVLDYPAQDGAFDIVFFNHVIEHIPEDVAALRSVCRILRPGGLLILGTPNEGAWWWQLAYHRAPEVLATTDHVHFYTADTIAAKMRAAGLAVGEVHHMGWGPPDWSWDGRLRGYKLLDDLFELVGRALIPRQASSLYLIASKEA